jgi:protein TonB
MKAIAIAAAALLCLNLAVSGQETPKKLTKAEALAEIASKSLPEYPAVAKQLKLEGTVEVEAVVAEDGSVEQVNIVSGNPVLTKAAVAAVKKWKFNPIKADGKPTKALAPLSLSFKL